MMGKHYQYKAWEVKRLTFNQVKMYMENLRYVMDMSKDFGSPPEPEPITHILVEFAQNCGIVVPWNVRYDLSAEGASHVQDPLQV